MALTEEQAQEESQAFADAFASDEGRAPEPSEDEAFGLAEPADPEEDVTEDRVEEATEEASEPAADPTVTEDAETAPAEEEVDVAVVVTPEVNEVNDGKRHPPGLTKEQQTQKSWEGRLKAWEAELKAREEALKAGAPAEMPAETAAEAPTAEAVEAVAAQVESGEMTVDEAVATLGNDFGPEFTKMLSVLIKSQAREIAAQLADEKVGAVRGEVDGLANEIVDSKKREHFELISEAHPDFVEVAGSPEFKAYVDSLPGSEQEAATQVINSGTARQINKLLSSFKAAKVAEPEDTQAMDDAEGVRSSGLKIPEKPKMADSYEDAWDEFN